jgi:hypothetical protein
VNYLDIDWLRANHTMIHYFGLGFIQVKLGESERVHLYIPGLDPIVSEEDIHDHRYHFDSLIMAGSLSQDLFTVEAVDQGTHAMDEVSCEEGEEPRRVADSLAVQLMSGHTYAQGSSYSIRHDQFHRVRTHPDGCATLVRRSGYMKPRARVVKPIGAAAICPFSRKIPEGELWGIVAGFLESR